MQTLLKCKLNIGRVSWLKKNLLRFLQSFKMHHKTKNVLLQNNILASFMVAKKGNYDCHENTSHSCMVLTKEPLYECSQNLALYTLTFPKNQIVFPSGVNSQRNGFLLIVVLYQSSFGSQLDHLSFGTVPTYSYVRPVYTDLQTLRHGHYKFVSSYF